MSSVSPPRAERASWPSLRSRPKPHQRHENSCLQETGARLRCDLFPQAAPGPCPTVGRFEPKPEIPIPQEIAYMPLVRGVAADVEWLTRWRKRNALCDRASRTGLSSGRLILMSRPG